MSSVNSVVRAVRARRDLWERVDAAAEAAGVKRNAWVVDAMERTLERDTDERAEFRSAPPSAPPAPVSRADAFRRATGS
jgi:hypothetical protein